ncbi:MAG: pseudouridine synthase [Candidatus Omnitrophota bacterium]
MSKEKLQKALQAAGVGSRRSLREQIHDGAIRVNNKVVTDPNFVVDIEKDMIRLNDKRLKLKVEQKSYFILNKPTGVVSTLHDPEGRPTIVEYIKEISERVYPVGRLDYHSEGLILLTNDGDLTNFIISTRNKIPKVYMVKIKSMLSDEKKEALLTKGLFLEGRRIKPQKIDFVKKTTGGNSWIRVTIVEGKKHIIRNLFKFIGHPVEKLKRLSIGTFELKKLPLGHWRELTREELLKFKRTYGFDTFTTQERERGNT